jgi:hypothetical protein
MCAINLLKPSGSTMYHLLQESVPLHFVFMGLVSFSAWTAIISLNGVNQLIFAMVKCCVLFEVRTRLLNTICTSFGFKGLLKRQSYIHPGEHNYSSLLLLFKILPESHSSDILWLHKMHWTTNRFTNTLPKALTRKQCSPFALKSGGKQNCYACCWVFTAQTERSAWWNVLSYSVP